jgi:DNA-binding transcriptional LysR family regulator
MPDMELRRFRYFVAVAEELHFRRAAERLHLAQPALSQQVRKLEVELGVDLLVRTKRGVALTPAGALFLEEARRLLRQADEAVRIARNAQSGAAGRLRVGHVVDSLPALLPRTIAAFCARHPAIEVTPEPAPARRAVEDVRAGRLDVALVGLPVQAEGLKITPIAVERTVAAVSDRHVLSGRPEIALTALEDTPLIMLPRPVNPAFYDAVIAGCRSAAIAPALVEMAEPTVEHALLLVASGLGIALLPASVADRYMTTGVSFRPIAQPAPTTELAFIARLDPGDVTVAAFLRVARELDGASRDLAAVLGGLEPVPDLPMSA